MIDNPLPSDVAVLVLADGTVFHGKAAGSRGTSFGEIAFNTGMYGYQEIFTDPSYHKQIVVMATAHIGNYGVHEGETESSGPRVAGVVARNFSSVASRPGGSGTLQDDLESHDVVGIRDVDTRALVTHIREHGAMNAVVSSDGTSVEELKAKLSDVPSMEGMELSSQVSVTEVREAGVGNAHRVALLDLGVKESIVRCLVDRGCHVKVFPWDSAAGDLLAWNPEGIMLSNGPGDPAAMPGVVAEVAKLVESGLPVFGICLGAPSPGVEPRGENREDVQRPPRGEPPGQEPDHRHLRNHLPEPRVCDQPREPGIQRGCGRDPRPFERQHRGRHSPGGTSCVQCAIPP